MNPFKGRKLLQASRNRLNKPSEPGLIPESGRAVFEASDENSEDGIDLYNLIVNEKQQYFSQIWSAELIY